MSWYRDGEPFDEWDDPYCIWRNSNGRSCDPKSKADCDRCLARAYEKDECEEEEE
jgi:hypothetical protein